MKSLCLWVGICTSGLIAVVSASQARAQEAPATATAAVPAPDAPAAVSAPALVPSSTTPPAPMRRDDASTQDVAQVRNAVDSLAERLSAQIDSVRPAWWERFVPALIGLVGVFVGGWVSWRLQSRQLALNVQLQQQQLRENDRLGRAKAGYESLSKVVDHQMRQVNEFYSPLRLMLQRSMGVRRQLCDQLVAKDPQRFQMRSESGGREHLYVLAADGDATPFRLIQHMYELATKHAEMLPLVKEIVAIGVAMTDLIKTKGGMAITGSDAVNNALARYLAHFSILQDVADKAEKTPALLETLQYNVAYPRELDAALDADIAVLTGQIDTWKALSREMWDQARSSAAPA
jgi:hypothetical protein